LLQPDLLDYGDHVWDGQPYLRLAPIREFVPKVPFRLFETKAHYKNIELRPDQMGPVLLHQVPVVTGNDLDSLLSAFNKRCNYHSPQKVSSDIMHDSLALAKLIFPNSAPYFWSEDLYLQWLSKFSTAKQQRMRSALLNLADVDLRRLSTKELMVKSEVLLKRNDGTWAPRIIYIGSDEYNVLTGPLMNEFTRRLSVALDEISPPGVKFMLAYSKKDTTLANFISGSPDDNFYEGDFAANDRNQVSSVRDIFAFWLQRSGAPDWFVSLYLKLAAKFTVVCREYGLKATLQNQLATGVTDTTGRNSVWNMCLFYSYARRHHLTGLKVLLLGDDIAINAGSMFIDCFAWIRHCERGQMVLKASSRRFYCDLTFLSRFFVPAPGGNCMIPLICKALCRFNARANRNQTLTDAQYMAGKCLSYSYEFRHVPFMVDFFVRRFIKTGVQTSELKLSDLTWFSRSQIESIGQLIEAVRDEPVKIEDADFLEIVMAKYDIGLWDMEQLCEALICDDRPSELLDQRYYLMAHEVE
jgi:hypothetical protein